jgi:rhamnulokinase
MSEPLYIAVDLGAGSGRVFLCGVAEGELLLEEARRFHYPPREVDGRLRWDFAHILAEIRAGLRDAGEKASALGRVVVSVGVDSWGVDYGLVDGAGRLVEDPVCYRDARTERERGRVAEVLGRQGLGEEWIFARTGIQFLPFNTLFQLSAHARAGVRPEAERLLMIPDLLNLALCGAQVVEFTNATTTQLVNAASGDWDWELIGRLGLPGHLLADIAPPGTQLGVLRPEIETEAGLEGVRVIAPTTHDTGSAVAGAPLADGWAYISSGTWSLVGVELGAPLISDSVARHNFTNEGGAGRTARFLKNVMGLWVLESCRREWRERGAAADYDTLLAEVAARPEFPALIYPDDGRLFNPRSMTAAISEQLAETGQAAPDEPAALAKVILDSLALRYASVVRTIEELTGREVQGVQVVGGGSRNDYLNQATANATGKPVLAGPVESTVVGNAVVQAITAGRSAAARRRERQAAALRAAPVGGVGGGGATVRGGRGALRGLKLGGGGRWPLSGGRSGPVM